MTKKVYRTAQGQIVDMGALALQNEQVRAVGNMNINARGDVIDSNGRVIKSANERVGAQYKKQVSNVQSTPVTRPQAPAQQREGLVADTAPPVVLKEVPEEVVFPEDFDDEFVKEEVAAPAVEQPAAKTGLAGALAKAKKD